MITLNETFPKEFNIIPIPRNSKIPIFKWEIYQEKRYDKPIHENNGNYAVICGKISNNLLVLDIDFKDKNYFKEIFLPYKKKYPELINTKIVQTPHGFHFYYYTKDFSVDRKPNKNAGYNDKNKFTGSLKTQFKRILEGFDILGNNGYDITWNSKINDSEYKCINSNPIKVITKNEFSQIKNFFLLDKPTRMRKSFYDILNGKIEIEEQASSSGCDEFLYWKALYRETYHYLGLEPKELYKGLDVNQPSFDMEKTETQIQYHPFIDKPFTNEQLSKMFPSYNFGKTERKGKETEKKESEEIENFDIADLILSKNDIKTIEESGEMLLYEDGVYKRNKRRKIRTIITEILRELEQNYSKKKEVDVLSLLGNITLVSIEEFDKKPYILNLKNGLLNILTEKIEKHNPKYLSFRRIPLTYNPDMSCPLIDAFLIDIFHKEDISFMEEYTGLSLTSIMDFQRALLLYGAGNNGKTTFLNLVQSFIGKKNCSNIDISKFKYDSVFAQIEDKLINVVPDIDTETKINIQRFKDYVGNALLILINKKYKDPYSIHPTAKLIYSCNSTYPEIPSNTDKGFWRKWIFIECPRSLDKIEVRDKLNELMNENEFSGFLNKVIKGFKRLHERGKFEEQYNNWELIKDTWIENKNVVQEFIKEKCIEDPNSYVIQKEFINKLNEWLKVKGRLPLYAGTVTKKINSNPLYEKSRKRIGGERHPIYKGFRFIEIEKIQIEKFMESDKNE